MKGIKRIKLGLLDYLFDTKIIVLRATIKDCPYNILMKTDENLLMANPLWLP